MIFPSKINRPTTQTEEDPIQTNEDQGEGTTESPEPSSNTAASAVASMPPMRRKLGTPLPTKQGNQGRDPIGLTTRIRADLHQRLKFHAFVNSRPISKVIEDLAETLPPVPQVYAKQ